MNPLASASLRPRVMAGVRRKRKEIDITDFVRMVNRSAAVIRPREPFVKWATSLDPDPKQFEHDLRSHVSVYLVPPDPEEEEESAPLDQWFGEVFERELDGWHTNPAAWPARRDLATFLEWFEVLTESAVVDLGVGPIEVEEV